MMKNWIEHYLWQGVEHFFLIDNDSTDNPLLILQEYIDKNIVSYYYKPEKHKQVEHYQFIYDNYNLKNKTKWLIVADLDEFWYSSDKLVNIIDNYYNYDVIYSNWLMFGHNNNILHPTDIRLSNLYRVPTIHSNTKWIIKTESINSDDINIHTINNNNCITVNDKIKLNHYPIPSLEYYKKIKMTHGDADALINVRDKNYFINYNKNTNFRDTELVDLILKDNNELNDWKVFLEIN